MTDTLSITSEDLTENPSEKQNQNPKELTQLPVSYVLWLTMRSRFIDAYAKTNPEILNYWSEFEAEQMSIIEKEANNAD
jgi:hypothetical protein